VVHAIEAAQPDRPRFGLVVSKAVGGSVVRHRVSRRIRHSIAASLSEWDAAGFDVVVRALPAAATASSHEIASDLLKCRLGLVRVKVPLGGSRG
jgi:ribonuclease P protein component